MKSDKRAVKYPSSIKQVFHTIDDLCAGDKARPVRDLLKNSNLPGGTRFMLAENTFFDEEAPTHMVASILLPDGRIFSGCSFLSPKDIGQENGVIGVLTAFGRAIKSIKRSGAVSTASCISFGDRIVA